MIYQHEPNPLACGQAVLGMLCGEDALKVCEKLGNQRETTLKEMRDYLKKQGLLMGEKTAASEKTELPQICVLSLETPRCWHWSLFREGVFYDPEHGVLNDFPVSARKYYFEITSI
ncbi:MAG: hypothetical protein KBS52_01540 [Clostridiales bacterium]|nr:hypothetical protein [Candidatus Equinaster intestinalis]